MTSPDAALTRHPGAGRYGRSTADGDRQTGQLGVMPDWASWAGEHEVGPYSVGVEEEVMLLEPGSWELANRAEDVLSAFPTELRAHLGTETHSSAIELKTGVHPDRDGIKASMIDPESNRLVPAAELLGDLLAACVPHAGELGCEGELGLVFELARRNGCPHQLAVARRVGDLPRVLENLAEEFCR